MWARCFNFLWRAGRKPTRQARTLAKQEISPSKKSRQVKNLAKQEISPNKKSREAIHLAKQDKLLSI